MRLLQCKLESSRALDKQLNISLFCCRYSMTSTVKVCDSLAVTIVVLKAHYSQRLLDHLKEAAFYSAKDLDSVSHTLDTMSETLDRGKETYSPHLLTLLENRLDTCRNILVDLKVSLADSSPELTPIHERLVSILRSISAANTRYKVRVVPGFGTLLTYRPLVSSGRGSRFQ